MMHHPIVTVVQNSVLIRIRYRRDVFRLKIFAMHEYLDLQCLAECEIGGDYGIGTQSALHMDVCLVQHIAGYVRYKGIGLTESIKPVDAVTVNVPPKSISMPLIIFPAGFHYYNAYHRPHNLAYAGHKCGVKAVCTWHLNSSRSQCHTALIAAHLHWREEDNVAEQ